MEASPRFLLAAMFVFCLLLGAFMWRYRRAQAQARTVSELKAIGCLVAYDYEIQEKQFGELVYVRNSKSSISPLLINLLGPDFFHDVAGADAPDSHSGHPKSDDEISQFWAAVVRFPKLQCLISSDSWCQSQEFNQIAGSKSLRSISLSGGALTNAHMKTLASIPNLQAIDIYLNRAIIDDEGVKGLSGLKQLRSISIDCFRLDDILEEPPLTDAAVTNLCLCTKLESVVLPFKGLTNNSARELAKLPHLRRLDLSNSQLSDAGIAHFKNSLELEEIIINHTGVSGPGFLHLRAIPRVRKLCMQGTPLGDEDLEFVNVFRELEILDLSDTALADKGLSQHGLPPNLVKIALDDTAMTDAALWRLGECHRLKDATLWNTKTTPQGIAELQKAHPGCFIQVGR